MSAEFDRRAAIARGAIRADFGEGWMTSGARDMVRIAAFAGFDVSDLVKRVAMTANPDRMTNARTVDRVMSEMDAEFNTRVEGEDRAFYDTLRDLTPTDIDYIDPRVLS